MLDLNKYLEQTPYIDCDSPAVRDYAQSVSAGSDDKIDMAVRLYYAVRDGILYNPYALSLEKNTYAASFVLSRGEGYCIQKAILLAAASRAMGIPCRLRFAIVRNHLVTRRLRELMKTDLFAFHGYNEFHLDGKWVKATSAFNKSLCDKFGIFPLEFSGRDDSVFHPYDREGHRHMEYVHDYGFFPDFPYELMVEEYKRHYPHFFANSEEMRSGVGDFAKEAEEENPQYQPPGRD